MGHLVNPIGVRLNNFNFWELINPWLYNQQVQYTFTEISLSIKVLLNLILEKCYHLRLKRKKKVQNLRVVRKLRIKGGTRKYKLLIQRIRFRYNIIKYRHDLLGLTTAYVCNFSGFENQNVSIFFSLLDMKLLINFSKSIRKRFFLGKFLKTIKFISAARQNASLVCLKKKRTFLSWFKFAWGWTFLKKFKKFIYRYFKYTRRVLSKKLKLWHWLFVFSLKPYFLFLSVKHKLKFISFFFSLRYSTISSWMLARYAVMKLEQGFDLNFVFKNLRKGMRMAFQYAGYKICFSGRFNRKQIATYRWVRNGHLMLNKMYSGIDYVEERGHSLYGAFGIKLWFYSSGLNS